jgi:predicted metal-dependent phosphoesterase TrpH
MKKYIDLHMHSKYSDDGEFEPKELVRQCQEAGIRIMAIADHNSVKAIDEEKEYCKKAGITCIPAIEIDCTFKGVNLHVVGYGMDYTSKEMIALEENVLRQELACSKEKLEITNALGFHLVEADLQAVSDTGVWTGEMFGEVLLEKPEYQDHELLKPYRVGGTRSDNPFVNFYWDYYAQGKPCYTEIVYPTLEEVIALIRKLKGVSVLAHPGNNLKDKYELFDDMIALGINGVEVFSSYHSAEAITYFYDKAKANGLLITCGSDYHGKTKPAITIGDSRCNIDQSSIEQQLKEYGLVG